MKAPDGSAILNGPEAPFGCFAAILMKIDGVA